MVFELMKEQLKGEYREAFSAVWVYGTIKNVSDDVLTDTLTELYDILLTAQSEGKEVKRIVGSDIERFCKDIYQDYTVADRIKHLPYRLYRLVWVIFVLEFLTLIIPSESTGTSVSNVASYLFSIGLGVIFELLCRFIILPLMFKNKRIKQNAWSTVALLSVAVFVVGFILFENYFEFELNAPVLPLVIGSGMYIAVYFTVRSILRYKNYGTIHNEHKQMLKDSYYKNLSNIQIETTVLKRWKKDYEKRTKKGNIDPEAFMEKLKKDERILDWVNNGVGLFLIIKYVSSVIQMAIECESLNKLLFVAFITGILVFVIWGFLFDVIRRGSAVRKKLIRECEASGQTMPQYIESRLSFDD